jgi:hypothetical protein
MQRMGEEIELAAKAIGESMDVLVERSGLLGPVKELSDWVTSYIHYRRQPALARVIAKAADRIRRDGSPAVAISDKLLRDVLEGASMEDDPFLQDLWANLLANAVEGGDPRVLPALPRILRSLGPREARFLDTLIDQEDNGQYIAEIDTTAVAKHQGLRQWELDNLERLGLIRLYAGHAKVTKGAEGDFVSLQDAMRRDFGITELGSLLILVCHEPRGPLRDANAEG